MNGLLRRYRVLPRYTLFPREIFRRDEEDRRRRCRGHRRGGLTKYPAEKIRGTAGVVRELCGLGLFESLLGGRPDRFELPPPANGRRVAVGAEAADIVQARQNPRAKRSGPRARGKIFGHAAPPRVARMTEGAGDS